MPELPEVETIKRQLANKIIGKKLQGKEVKSVQRRAKMIAIDFTDGSSLVFHLKLTGQLIFNAEPGSYTRQVFKFDNGDELLFNDKIKFGWFKHVKNKEELKEIRELGPEPFDLTPEDFAKRLSQKGKGMIKPLLMDQKFISGIGNIYADEILFSAKVKPNRKVNTLTEKETEAIFASMRKILKAAIKAGGSSVRDYIDAFGGSGGYKKEHKVYQRTGKPCLVCKTLIKRIKIGGRSAHFCPHCQK